MANSLISNGGAAFVPPDLLNDASTPDLNPDYFDVTITDLIPDTDYALQFAWVYEDKTLSPYSASLDLHTDPITIPEVSNIATEWQYSSASINKEISLVVTFDRPEETINGITNNLADSFIITFNNGVKSESVTVQVNPNKTQQKYTLSQSTATKLFGAAYNHYTGTIQVVNLDGKSSGVSFVTTTAGDGITGQDIDDASWALSKILDGYIVTWAQFSDSQAKAAYDYTEVWQSTAQSGTYTLIASGLSPQPIIYFGDLGTKYVKIRHVTKKQTYSNYSNVKQIKAADPSGYDANGPTNSSVISAGAPAIDGDGLFDFNYKVPFSWNENSDSTTLGYKLRWRISGSTDAYTYMSVPGKSSTTAQLFGVLAGQTYEVGLNVYDEYDNVTGTWSNTTVTVPSFSGNIKDGKYLSAGDMKLGYGVGPGGETKNKGLYLSQNNYWYVYGNTVTDNSAKIKVGSSVDNLYWDGTDLGLTGTLTSNGAIFKGSVSVGSDTISGQLRVVQSFDTDGTPLKGIELGKFSDAVATQAGVSHGIYAYDKSNTAKYVLIDASTGSIRATDANLTGSLKTGTSTSYIHVGESAGSIKFQVSGFTYPGQITYESLYGSQLGSMTIAPPTNNTSSGNTPYIDIIGYDTGSGSLYIYGASTLSLDATNIEFGNSATTARFQGDVKFDGRTYVEVDQPDYVGAGSNPTMRSIWIRPTLVALDSSSGKIGDVWIQYA